MISYYEWQQKRELLSEVAGGFSSSKLGGTYTPSTSGERTSPDWAKPSAQRAVATDNTDPLDELSNHWDEEIKIPPEITGKLKVGLNYLLKSLENQPELLSSYKRRSALMRAINKAIYKALIDRFGEQSAYGYYRRDLRNTLKGANQSNVAGMAGKNIAV